MFFFFAFYTLCILRDGLNIGDIQNHIYIYISDKQVECLKMINIIWTVLLLVNFQM